MVPEAARRQAAQWVVKAIDSGAWVRPLLHDLRHLLWAQSLVGSNVCVVVGFSGGNMCQMLRTGPGSPKLLSISPY